MIDIAKAALAAGLVATVATTPHPATAAVRTDRVSARDAGVSAVAEASDYHRRRWRNRRLDVDAGDVIVGIGLIAAIAAIAGANDSDRGRERANDRRRYDDRRDRDYDRSRRADASDVGSAVGLCTEAAERSANARVDEIRSVTREGAGWQVEGDVGSDNFVCETSNGQVDMIRINDRVI